LAEKAKLIMLLLLLQFTTTAAAAAAGAAVLPSFLQDYPGEPVTEETFTHSHLS